MSEAKENTSYETPKEQLEVLNKAIYAILAGGQSYKIGTRSLTRADLATLIEERNRIEMQIQGKSTELLDGAYAVDFGWDHWR